MLAQAQSLLSKSMGAISSSSSSIKALAGSHPVAVVVIVGIGAYYAVNKYWLNKDEEVAEVAAEGEAKAKA